MDRTEITAKLTGIFRKVFHDDSLVIADAMTANDVERWDSLSHMILITEIEKAFSVRFRLKELNKMRNIGEMKDLISSKL